MCRLAKGRLATGRKQGGLKHNEAYRTPIFWTGPLPKVCLVPSKFGGRLSCPASRRCVARVIILGGWR